MAEQPSVVNTTFPVYLPEMTELRLPKSEFEAAISSLLHPANEKPTDGGDAESVRIPDHPKADHADGSVAVPKPDAGNVADSTTNVVAESAFMRGLLADKATAPTFDDRDGKMLTENADVAYRTSGEALVDLFHELEDVVSGDRLCTILDGAWDDDADATLKIIWNARSIHLGKSSRTTFYRAVGWLAERHPATLLANLPWLVRPLIPKKAPSAEKKQTDKQDVVMDDEAEVLDPKDADSDFEMIDEKEGLDGQPELERLKLDEDASHADFDVKYGVAHGYWKDLLNILALAANDELKVDGNPRSVLNSDKLANKACKRDWTPGRKKTQMIGRHDQAIEKLTTSPFYKTLHLTVARLFADQLKADLVRLQSGKKRETKLVTLAGKWAPSHKGMHDQHTFVVSTIAELLHPFESVCPDADQGDRTLYLKYARQAYQAKTLSPLRKHLQIVERPISAKRFEEINYERISSLAMKQYTGLFIKRDVVRFGHYLEDVAQGKARISGATLFPSTLIRNVRTPESGTVTLMGKIREIELKSADGQWNTLVQRIKESGTLSSSIAVCDVSGSMESPRFHDGTCPVDSAIGLSLLVAEVTKPPFGGAFVTFSGDPQVVRVGGVDDKRNLQEKVMHMQSSDWGFNTDFVAVFERLILPMAIEHDLKQEDMVKQLFVFSDMQFDRCGGDDRWTTSYERIQRKYTEAGYEMPKLIFWNLAGGGAGFGSSRGGYGGRGRGVRGRGGLGRGGMGARDDRGGDDKIAPKPVAAADEGTTLVSGYSQGQMKMFLDGGQFEDPEDEEEEVEEEQEGEGEDGWVVEKKKVKKVKLDAMSTVRKAIGHEAYRMLKVVD